MSLRGPSSRSHHLGRRISALADGTLTGPRADRLLAHVAHCPACQNALEQERRTRTAVEALPSPAPPPELLNRLHGLAVPGGPVGPRRRPMPHGVGGGRPVPSPGAAVRSANPARRPVSRTLIVGGVAASLVAVTSAAYAVGGPAPADGPVVPLAAGARAGEHVAAAAGRTLGGAASEGGTVTTAAVVTVDNRSTVLVGLLPTATPEAGVDAGELLTRAAVAARSVAYAGTRMTVGPNAGKEGIKVEVLHLPGHGSAYMTEPAGEEPGRAGFVPDLDAAALDAALLRKHYTARVVGRAVIAGRPTTAIEVGSSGEAPAARIWVDEASGLVLRKDVFGPNGNIETRTAYLDIAIGARVEGSVHLPPTATSFAGRSLGTQARPAFVDAGWVCPESLPGGFDLVDVRRSSGDLGPRLQLVYSDGLSTLSVFEQSGRLAEDASDFVPDVWDGRALLVRDGMPSQVAWAADGRVWTLVADTSRERVRAVVAALPRESAAADSGLHRLGARIGQGATRLASWANPFA